MRDAPTILPPPPARDFVHLARDAATGIEAVTAQFHGHAYDMHRHDDEWLVGVTHAGVQDFFCRGARRQSTTGRVILMEPGERHDGQAVQAQGFRYSMLYLPAAWLRRELDDRDGDVGFVQPLADDQRLAKAVAAACFALASPQSALAFDAARDEVLACLRRQLGRPAPVPQDRHAPGVAQRAMDYLRAHHADTFGLDELARVAGASDRFQLARAFRRSYGCSPHACLVEIRLEKARALLRAGTAPADAAFASGFADQSHLGRRFRRAYGLTPAVYRVGRTNVPDTGD